MDLIETIKSALKGRLHNTTLPLFPTKNRLKHQHQRSVRTVVVTQVLKPKI